MKGGSKATLDILLEARWVSPWLTQCFREGICELERVLGTAGDRVSGYFINSVLICYFPPPLINRACQASYLDTHHQGALRQMHRV